MNRAEFEALTGAPYTAFLVWTSLLRRLRVNVPASRKKAYIADWFGLDRDGEVKR